MSRSCWLLMVHQSVAILVHYYSRICISWISPPSAITSFTWKLFLEGSWLWRVYNDNIAGYRLFPLHMWPHGSSLKAEAPLGRLWSRAQTVAHSAAVPSRPASLAAALIEVSLLWNTKSQQSLHNWRRSGENNTKMCFYSSFFCLLL